MTPHRIHVRAAGPDAWTRPHRRIVAQDWQRLAKEGPLDVGHYPASIDFRQCLAAIVGVCIAAFVVLAWCAR